MPVLKTAKVYLKQLGKYPENVWVKRYSFNPKFETFSLNLPEEFLKLFPRYEVTGKSINDVDNAWHTAMKKWDDVQTHVRKVILYRFAINLWEKDDDSKKLSKVRQDFRGSSWEAPPDFALGFEYEVGMERVINGKAAYYQLAQSDGMRNEDFTWKVQILTPGRAEDIMDTQVIDHTPERETFFANLQVGLIGLINKIMTFEDTISDVKKLDGLVKSLPPGNLLLGPSK